MLRRVCLMQPKKVSEQRVLGLEIGMRLNTVSAHNAARGEAYRLRNEEH